MATKWLQKYECSDWLLSWQTFLVMTGHYSLGVQGIYNLFNLIVDIHVMVS